MILFKKGVSMRFVSFSNIAIGLMIIAQWSFFLITSNVPELKTAPVSISFHIAAEMMLALFLIISGIMLIMKRKLSREIIMIAQGMLIYSAVNSSGYFAQNGQWVFLLMFAVIISISMLNIILVSIKYDKEIL